MSNSDLFKSVTTTALNQLIANHMPQGKLWEGKTTPSSLMFKLIESTAVTLSQAQMQIENLAQEFDIPSTTALLPEWERDVGIPDECTDLAADLVQRRKVVIERLSKQSVVTLAEFQALGELLLNDPAVTLTVIPGVDHDPPLRVPETRPVALLNRFGSTAVVTTPVPHEQITGATVTIAGADQPQYNGTFTIIVLLPTVFSYAVVGLPTTPATGTITFTADFDAVARISRFRLYLSFSAAALGFPYAFPYAFGGFNSALIFCVFEKLVPANVVVLPA